MLKAGMYVRCPVDAEDMEQPRDFALAKVMQINTFAETVCVHFYDCRGIREYYKMPEETAKLLKIKGVNRAAVLATDGTVQSGLYGAALERVGIQPVYPDEEQQKIIMALIYNYIKKGVTDINDLPREEVTSIVGDLSGQGAEALLLACTELPIAFNIMGLRSEAFVDPTIVLAKSAIRMAGAHIRKADDH